MKALCPVCQRLVPVTYAPGPQPKPTIVALHSWQDRTKCRGSGAVDANWKPPVKTEVAR